MVDLYKCIDGGSKYCPCHLADNDSCISCSILRGEKFCDCNWNGVCIFYEYRMNNYKSKEQRKIFEGYVEKKMNLSERVILLKIKVEKELIDQLNRFGSYVFIKGNSDIHYFEAPMSIFDLDENHIYIVYQEIGVKTKKLNEKLNLDIRGPYWNGIIGINNIDSLANSNCAIITRGIGQSSIGIPLKKLAEKNNEIVIFLDKGKINLNYIDLITDVSNLKIIELDVLSEEGQKQIEDYLINNQVNLVFSAGADVLHRKISNIIKNINKEIKFAATNNNLICCGEGICGSCTRKMKNGKRIKSCKAIINPNLIY